MAFFMGLISWYGIFWLVSLLTPADPFAEHLQRGVYAAAAMFTTIGISHFAKPEKLEAMMPEHWPRQLLNYTSGAAEIVFGLGLLLPATRSWAAMGLLLLLVAVFPANIYVTRQRPGAYTISRLFFQPVYMAWIIYFCRLWQW